MDVQISVLVPTFTFGGHIPRSGIAGSDGNAKFNFLRKLHTVLHSSCTILHSHQQCTRVPISPHPCQHLLCSGFSHNSIVMGVKWYLILILISISLMTNDIEHLFTCLLAICIFSLQRCLFKPFAHFLIRLFAFVVIAEL